jgi:Fur family zinc uptake transcriptional regulator
MTARALNENDSQVLDALCGSARPLSAYEILDLARSGALKAPVQVYRSLQKLESRGFVHRIQALSAFVACADHGHEHDHASCNHKPGFVICRDCGAVREFEDERVASIATAAAGADFSIELVSLEVFGRCAACRAAAPEAGGSA